MLKPTILLFTFLSVYLLTFILVPFLSRRYDNIHKQEVRRVSGKLEDMFVWVEEKKLMLYLALSPLFLGLILFILFRNVFVVFIGVIFGAVILPMFLLKQLQKIRKAKFASQLVDALTSMSQSLKAGLSFLQSLEVIVEDMPSPMAQEIALVVKENKMGIPLEVSFERLNKKMESDDFNLVTTAILVARETGGNLTEVFTHLTENIRTRKRISDQVKTLTIQARYQGMIMSALPIFFAFFVHKMNAHFFDIMLESDTGRMLLIWCVISEIIGAYLLNRLSKVEV